MLPSPKFHNHTSGAPNEVSVNWTDKGAYPDAGVAVNWASGETSTNWAVDVEHGSDALHTIRVTGICPAVWNRCDAFGTVADVPSLKSHVQLTNGPPVEVSVNCTLNGTVPDIGENVKLALGAAVT